MTDQMTDDKPRKWWPPKRSGAAFGPSQNEILAALKNEPIQVALLDGRTLTGVLSSADTFTIGLSTPGGDFLLFKSSIKWLRRAPPTKNEAEP